MKRDYTVTRLPQLTPENIGQLMAERIEATKNNETVIPMLWQGFLELRIPVGDSIRTAKYYIPRNTPQGTTMVVMNVPQGERTVPFLDKSGWVDLADREGFCLFALEPAEDTWGTPAQEEAYLAAGLRAAIMGQYLLPAFAAHVVCYGAIGVGLHKAAMADPIHVAAAVVLDAGSVDSAYLAEYQEKCYQMPDRFDPAAEALCAPYRNIPIPVWFAADTLDSQTEAMLDYWKAAAKTGEAVSDDIFGTVYPQCQPTDYTPEGNILKVAVNGSLDYCCSASTEKIYRFLKQYYRYGQGPLSNAVSKMPEYKAMGAQRCQFVDANGITREYLVYVPAICRDSSKKWPVILAYHGASQSMRNMMANGMLYNVADREGIILVYPESTLRPLPGELSGGQSVAYRPLWSLSPDVNHTELTYANEMLDRVLADYPVDPGRIYCTGHSMGCMMTNFLGSSAFSHRLAAVAATSGVLNARDSGGTQPLAAFMTAGQFELWNYLLSADGPVSAQIDMWLVRNGLCSEEDARAMRAGGATVTCKEGRYNNYVWKDAAGIPWVRYAWVTMKHHVHSAEECALFWEQWFSKWHIGADGCRHYSG